MKKKPIHWRTRFYVFQRDAGHCQYCGAELTFNTFTMDHVIPKDSGGTDDAENLRLSCATCNVRKGTKTVEQFRDHMTLAGTPLFGVITAAQAKKLMAHGIDLKLPPPVVFYFEKAVGL